MHISEFCLQQLTDRLASIHLTITKIDQLSDLPKREAEPLHLPDEAKSLDGVFRVQPETAHAASCFWQQSAPLVESDRIDGQGCPLCDFANLDDLARSLMVRLHNKIIQSGAWSRVKLGETVSVALGRVCLRSTFCGCARRLLAFQECANCWFVSKRLRHNFGQRNLLGVMESLHAD